jgi:hypothetical protein
MYELRMDNQYGLKVGDKALRRRSSDVEPEWVEFEVNETYLELIAEFPEDYKPLPPKNPIKANFYCFTEGCELREAPGAFGMTVEKGEEFDQDCPCCGGKLKLAGYQTFSVGKFRMLSTDDRRKMLLKRSSEHFKKHIRDKKIEMERKTKLPGT